MAPNGNGNGNGAKTWAAVLGTVAGILLLGLALLLPVIDGKASVDALAATRTDVERTKTDLERHKDCNEAEMREVTRALARIERNQAIIAYKLGVDLGD